MNIAVTTVLKPDADSLRRARKKAEDLRTAFYEREKNLFHMSEKYGEEGFLVYGKKPVFFWSKEGTYRFHLGTAVLRIFEMRKGHGDRLCNLLPGDCTSVLDCTFGQGRDSVILSWYLRKRGEVISLERSRPLYEVGKEGLAALSGMEGFRSAAVYDPLTEDVLQFAMRAARKKVIVKERPFSALFRTGLFTEIHGKRGQTTAYGVIKL